jgi:hypothetical protein
MKIGDIVKPVAVTCGHTYVIGKKYVIYAPYNNGGGGAQNCWMLRDPDTGINGASYITEAELAIYSLNKKELENRIKKMETDIDRDKKMMEYLEDEHKEEVETTEFFAWYIVQIMESEDPKKKEKISKLLNSVNNNINLDQLVTRR